MDHAAQKGSNLWESSEERGPGPGSSGRTERTERGQAGSHKGVSHQWVYLLLILRRVLS